MWLEAIFTKEDLQDVVARFAPLKILLGDNGSLLLVSPSDVSLVADKGIAVTCDATIHWPILGFDVPVAMHGLLVHIVPVVEERPDGATLVFRLEIDHAGVAMLPSFFDHTVTTRVNQELEKKHVELAWNFQDTLSHVFGLPGSLASASAFAIRATAGRVKATEKALGLAVDFEVFVRAREEAASASTPGGVSPMPPPEGAAGTLPIRDPSVSRGAFDSRSLAVGAAAAWLLLASLRALRGPGRRRALWRA
jgi:hypothetical protein